MATHENVRGSKLPVPSCGRSETQRLATMLLGNTAVWLCKSTMPFHAHEQASVRNGRAAAAATATAARGSCFLESTERSSCSSSSAGSGTSGGGGGGSSSLHDSVCHHWCLRSSWRTFSDSNANVEPVCTGARRAGAKESRSSSRVGGQDGRRGTRSRCAWTVEAQGDQAAKKAQRNEDASETGHVDIATRGRRWGRGWWAVSCLVCCNEVGIGCRQPECGRRVRTRH